MRNPVADLLEALASCLCRTIRDEEQPDLCFCGVIPGDGVVADYGSDCSEKNGLAWVRLASMYAASGTGVRNVDPRNCATLIGFDIEVGILRAVPVGEADGGGPTAGQLLASTQQQILDAQVMRRAINCCSALNSKDYILGGYEPGGPLGQMLGGKWTLSVAI